MRLVFNSRSGLAVAASVIDLGDRFRCTEICSRKYPAQSAARTPGDLREKQARPLAFGVHPLLEKRIDQPMNRKAKITSSPHFSILWRTGGSIRWLNGRPVPLRLPLRPLERTGSAQEVSYNAKKQATSAAGRIERF